MKSLNKHLIISIVFALSISAILSSCSKYSIDAIISTADKRIQQGDTTILKWEVFPNPEIVSITLDETGETLAAIGQMPVFPEQSKTFSLKVVNKKGKEKRFTCRLNILTPDFEEINYPHKVYDDDPILINWKASN